MTALIDHAVLSRLGFVLEIALIFVFILVVMRLCDLVIELERDRRARRRDLRRSQRLARKLAWQEMDEVTRHGIRSPW